MVDGASSKPVAPRGGYSAVAQTLPSLDGIRAVSALLVLVAHAGFGSLIPGGLGVTIFFFLSGFLITHLLMREIKSTGQISISQFYLRRAFRLFPPLVVTIILAYTLNWAGLISGKTTLLGLTSQLFYFANYFYIATDGQVLVPSGTNVLWSLAVEEQFYIVYPLLMAALLFFRVPAKKSAMILLAICAIVLAWRVFLVESGWAATSLRTFYGTDTRIDSLLFGCVLALLSGDWIARAEGSHMSLKMWVGFILGLVVLLGCLLVRSEVFRETFRYTLQGLALVPIFVAALKHPTNIAFRVLNTPVMMLIGRLSYSIYLVHFIVATVLVENLPYMAANHFALATATFFFSAAFALALDKTIEPYFRRLRAQHRPTAAPADRTVHAEAHLKAI